MPRSEMQDRQSIALQDRGGHVVDAHSKRPNSFPTRDHLRGGSIRVNNELEPTAIGVRVDPERARPSAGGSSLHRRAKLRLGARKSPGDPGNEVFRNVTPVRARAKPFGTRDAWGQKDQETDENKGEGKAKTIEHGTSHTSASWCALPSFPAIRRQGQSGLGRAARSSPAFLGMPRRKRFEELHDVRRFPEQVFTGARWNSEHRYSPPPSAGEKHPPKARRSVHVEKLQLYSEACRSPLNGPAIRTGLTLIQTKFRHDDEGWRLTFRQDPTI